MGDVVYVEKNYAPKYVYTPDPPRESMNRSDTGTDKRQQMFNAEGGVIPIIYGTQRVGGKIFAVRAKDKHLYIGVIFCEGEVDSFVSLEVNDKNVTEYTSVSYQTFLGTSSQTRSSFLALAFAPGATTAGSTYTDTLPNTCYAVLKFAPSEDLSGFPRISAVIKGKKVYDPRDSTQVIGTTSTYKWSNNPSLCLADLIRSSVYGLGLEFSTAGWESVTECANLDDVNVGSPAEVRRTLDIVVDKEQDTRAWIETLRGYASCFVVPENTGALKLIPDKIISYALNLDGTATSYMTLARTSQMPLTNGFSFDVSIRPDATISANAVVFAKGASASSTTDYLVTYSHGANSTFTVSFNNTGGTKTYTITTGVQLSTTTFSTLSFSLDKTGTSRAFLTTDTESFGPQITTLTVTNPGAYTYAPIETSSYDFRVGYQNSLVPFKGQIDEVRIWSRDRLEAEIRKYLRIPLIRNFDAALSVWLPFNEGYVSRLYSGTWTTIHKTKDYASNTWATISTSVSLTDPWFTPTVSAQLRVFGIYDYISFNGDNILDKSVRFKKRGILNVPNVIEISYTDKTVTPWIENYAQEDHSSPSNYRPSRVSMPGITRYSQAKREAIERYNTAFSDTVITFGVFDEALALNVGDGIQFHHPLLETSGSIFFKPYRITGIQQTGYGKYNLSVIEYEPSVYSTTAATSPSFIDTNLPSVNSPVTIPSGLISSTNTTGVSIAEEVYKNQYGIYTSRLRVKFSPADFPYVAEYLVELYKADGITKLEEARIPVASTISFSNPYTGTETRYEYVSSSAVNLLESNNDPTTYILKIYTISIARTRSTPATISAVTAGKTAKPPDVTSFTGYEIGGKVYLSWDEAVDIDITGYKIKYGDKTTLAALSVAAQWTAATALDITDTLRYNAANIASGERRFLIKALDSVGQESVNPAIKDIVVTKDSNSFTVGSIAVTGAAVASSATTNMSSWTERPNPIKWWISDYGNTLADDGSGAIGTTLSNLTYNWHNPHTSCKSVWTSSIADFGAISGVATSYYTGNLTAQVYPTAIHGAYTTYIDYSTTDNTFATANKNSTWFEAAGTSCVATARYVRIRIESTTTDTTQVFIVRDDAVINFDVNTKEEGGIVSITQTTGPTITLLQNMYNKAKSLILTPQGGGTANLSAQFDKLAVNSVALDGTQIQVDRTSTAAYSGWLGLQKSNVNIIIQSTDYLEYEVWIQPGSPGEFGDLGGMTFYCNDTTWASSSSMLDQNSRPLSNPNATGLASGKWYKRYVSISGYPGNTSAYVGKTIQHIYTTGYLTTPAVIGTTRFGVRNIRITTNALGAERVALYTTTSHPGIATANGWTEFNSASPVANFITQQPNGFDVYLLNTSNTKVTGQVSWVFRGM